MKDQLEADKVSIVAGGLALFGLLSVFPTLAAVVAIYGLIGSPDAIAAQAQTYSELLPAGVLAIIQNQLNDLAGQQRNTLSTGAMIGFMLALWSARRGWLHSSPLARSGHASILGFIQANIGACPTKESSATKRAVHPLDNGCPSSLTVRPVRVQIVHVGSSMSRRCSSL